ncbi:MAG: formate dehydrogenase accessory sulfurtransferase FdhD [Acidimicrobiales bacterium]|nr:formate dehydrogenase accessory sulfurtransferase FdhD [Acidimicrobiales bacterium]
MVRGRTAKVLTQRWEGGSLRRRPDELIVEEPLEVRLDDQLVATTMRTPGHDFELAVGLCHGDGLLAGAPVLTCRYCGTGSAVESEFNIVSVDTGGAAPPPAPRLGATTTACGLCGSTAIAELRDRIAPIHVGDPWSISVLTGVPERVRPEQGLFASTGAVHAAAAFDRGGNPIVVREDIGRHNAVDKVVGHLLLAGGLPATELGLYASGRAGFEIVQKAWAAGFSAVVAVSAPSALAVEAARQAGITLVGFVREQTANVYNPEGGDGLG